LTELLKGIPASLQLGAPCGPPAAAPVSRRAALLRRSGPGSARGAGPSGPGGACHQGGPACLTGDRDRVQEAGLACNQGKMARWTVFPGR